MHHWKVSFLKLSSVNSVNSIKPYSCIAQPPGPRSCKMVTLSALLIGPSLIFSELWLVPFRTGCLVTGDRSKSPGRSPRSSSTLAATVLAAAPCTPSSYPSLSWWPSWRSAPVSGSPPSSSSPPPSTGRSARERSPSSTSSPDWQKSTRKTRPRQLSFL